MLADKIIKMFKEDDPNAQQQIRAIVDIVGEDRAAKITVKAAELFKRRAKTVDGSRKRTLGGCWLFVAKSQMTKEERHQAGLYTLKELKAMAEGDDAELAEFARDRLEEVKNE